MLFPLPLSWQWWMWILPRSPLNNSTPPYMPADLPAVARAKDVYEHVRDHDVTIVCGETGCGKSSYIPTLLHRAHKIDQAIAKEKRKNSGESDNNSEEPYRRTKIYVTQPRRVAAVSLAKRVSELRGEGVGEGLVGYLIGQDRSVCNHTEIFYVTVGWLVERVVHDPEFIRRCSHIILDEVHERDVAADLLCLLVKRLLIQYRNDNTFGSPPKIVIMSATFDGELFANYFSSHNPPKPLYLGARRFPVAVFHLDEFPDFPLFQENPSCQPPRHLIRRAIDSVNSKMRTPEKIGSDELYDLLVWLCRVLAYLHAHEVVEKKLGRAGAFPLSRQHQQQQQNNNEEEEEEEEDKKPEMGTCVLVFFAGLGDIEDAYERLSAQTDQSAKLEVFALHSLLDREQQMAVFAPVPEGVTRIILATNIAESSITLPSARYVVDFGLHKMLMPSSQFKGCQSLDLQWCSKASLVQRMGRTGRLMPGTVFRFFTKRVYEDVCPQYDDPEICRLSLSSTVLKLKLMCDKWNKEEGEEEEEGGEEENGQKQPHHMKGGICFFFAQGHTSSPGGDATPSCPQNRGRIRRFARNWRSSLCR